MTDRIVQVVDTSIPRLIGNNVRSTIPWPSSPIPTHYAPSFDPLWGFSSANISFMNSASFGVGIGAQSATPTARVDCVYVTITFDVPEITTAIQTTDILIETTEQIVEATTAAIQNVTTLEETIVNETTGVDNNNINESSGEKKGNNLALILGSVAGVIACLIIVFLIIIFIFLRKKNQPIEHELEMKPLDENQHYSAIPSSRTNSVRLSTLDPSSRFIINGNEINLAQSQMIGKGAVK